MNGLEVNKKELPKFLNVLSELKELQLSKFPFKKNIYLPACLKLKFSANLNLVNYY